MLIPSQIRLEISEAKSSDFQEFLLCHRRIRSFYKTNNGFFINLRHKNWEEYAAFLEGIKEIFEIEKLKEIKFCQGKCRDGSGCLNRANYGGFCWRHRS